MTRSARLAVVLAAFGTFVPAAGCGGGGGGGGDVGGWTSTGSLTIARRGHSATPLLDGRVLVVGGTDFNAGTATTTAELYVPGAGTFGLTNPPVHPRGPGHTATRLTGGRVLVVGGEALPATAEVFDPLTDSFTLVAPPNVPRYGHVAVRMPDGRVLVAGGMDVQNATFVSSAEVYDPPSNTWTTMAPMPDGRAFAAAGLLPWGEVCVAGGMGAETTAVVYAPALNGWFPGGDLTYGFQEPTAATPSDGRMALVSAGYGSVPRGKIYDPGTGTWTDAPPFVEHNFGAAVALEDGRVLVAGGSMANGTAVTNACEVLDLLHADWFPLAAMAAARSSHAAALLFDGRVLVCGGWSGAIDLSSAEVIAP